MLDEEQETLGSYLRRERKKRDVSIEQIAYATRISLKMLNALEEDQHGNLPAQPFVRGYLKAYAKYVNLDPKDVLLRYQHHLATQPSEVPWNSQSRLDAEEDSNSEKRRLVWIACALGVILLGGGTFYWLRNKLQEENARAMSRAPVLKNATADVAVGPLPIPPSPALTAVPTTSTHDPLATLPQKPIPAPALVDATKTTAPKTPEAKPPVAPPPAPIPAPVVATPPVQPPPVVKPPPPEPPAPTTAATDSGPKKYNLSLKAKEDVWIRFQTDTDETKDLILRKDKTITIRAEKIIRMFSGNVRAMTGNLNGQALDSLTQGDWKRSVVIPFSEIPNVSLPLFPGGPGEGSSESARSTPKKAESGTSSTSSQ